MALLSVILVLAAGVALLLSGHGTPAVARSAPANPAAGSSATAVGIVSVAPVGTLPAMKLRAKPRRHAAAPARASSPPPFIPTAAPAKPAAPALIPAPTAPAPTAPAPSAPAPSAPAPSAQAPAPPSPKPTPAPSSPKPAPSGSGGSTGTTVTGGG
ncbi:MAG TPA: hypothetical protein VIM18_09555 [Solirubrobacteraceae bacterium]